MFGGRIALTRPRSAVPARRAGEKPSAPDDCSIDIKITDELLLRISSSDDAILRFAKLLLGLVTIS